MCLSLIRVLQIATTGTTSLLCYQWTYFTYLNPAEMPVVRIDELGRITARQAEKTNVTTVVAAQDADGIVRLREVGPEGQVFESETVALGDGAQVAVGQVETIDPALDLDETPVTVADIIEIVAERDATTGGGVDVWLFANAPGNDHDDEV